jgi:dimethylargininase
VTIAAKARLMSVILVEMLLAITRPVPPSITECELTHLERQPIDWARATEQHHEYECALQSLGCKLERLPVAPSQPDSVFIEDTAFVVDECAVIARPGAPSRRAETSVVADALRPYRQLAAIEAPATLDGGDVLRIGRRVYVGMSTRTNAEGIRQLAALLVPHGYSVESVVVRECLHLKTAVSALGDDRLLLNPRMVDGSAFGGASWIEIDPAEPSAANVIYVGKTVLIAANAPRTRRRLEANGYDVIEVDASELAKAEAGLTCCSVILRV